MEQAVHPLRACLREREGHGRAPQVHTVHSEPMDLEASGPGMMRGSRLQQQAPKALT